MKILKTALTTIALSFSLAAMGALAQTAQQPPENQAGATQSQQTATDHGTAGSTPQTGDQMEPRPEAERKRCESLSGDEKDICEKQADANRDPGKAENERKTGTAEPNQDANKEKKDAQYQAEKSKCEAMSGDARDRCITDVNKRLGR